MERRENLLDELEQMAEQIEQLECEKCGLLQSLKMQRKACEAYKNANYHYKKALLDLKEENEKLKEQNALLDLKEENEKLKAENEKLKEENRKYSADRTKEIRNLDIIVSMFENKECLFSWDQVKDILAKNGFYLPLNDQYLFYLNKFGFISKINRITELGRKIGIGINQNDQDKYFTNSTKFTANAVFDIVYNMYTNKRMIDEHDEPFIVRKNVIYKI